MKIKILIFLFLLIPLITANGLQILNDSININKTVGDDTYFTFDLKNMNNNITFYDISIEDNFYVTMPIISKLEPYEIQTVNITVKSDADFNGQLRIFGYYNSTIGSGNITHSIDISLNGDFVTLIPCSFSGIKGDSVEWHNSNYGDVLLKNAQSGDIISEINESAIFTKQFVHPIVLDYYVSWLGVQISQICRITILDDTDFITNPEYDAFLDMNINVEYEPTIITTTFLETNYTLDAYKNEEGMFLIKNEGSDVAKNIHIESEWFTFSLNNFDLSPGYSKTIGYTLTPFVETTNETNKNYEKTMSITGNFPTISEIFNVFVNYADIDSGDYTTGKTLIEIIEEYCLQNQNASFCGGEPTIIYKSENNSENITNEQVLTILRYWYTEFSDVKEFITWTKENIFGLKEDMNATKFEAVETRSTVDEMNKTGFGAVNTIFVAIVSFLILIIVGGGIYLITYFKKHKLLAKLRRW